MDPWPIAERLEGTDIYLWSLNMGDITRYPLKVRRMRTRDEPIHRGLHGTDGANTGGLRCVPSQEPGNPDDGGADTGAAGVGDASIRRQPSTEAGGAVVVRKSLRQRQPLEAPSVQVRESNRRTLSMAQITLGSSPRWALTQLYIGYAACAKLLFSKARGGDAVHFSGSRRPEPKRCGLLSMPPGEYFSETLMALVPTVPALGVRVRGGVRVGDEARRAYPLDAAYGASGISTSTSPDVRLRRAQKVSWPIHPTPQKCPSRDEVRNQTDVAAASQDSEPPIRQVLASSRRLKRRSINPAGSVIPGSSVAFCTPDMTTPSLRRASTSSIEPQNLECK